ncbi:ArsI/CadI family heavy metal resistance metalloenzyme [Thalassospira australica]|uniref:ArsI/CadI family heavy metal resistance metalloenzyme n=1 Tax=Thalassospira australica TaxID=1528106 RepID=UPI000519EDB9|nr:ArsI/CadI family heavy metal resistance metalloenzyme [Thalassospira australica]
MRLQLALNVKNLDRAIAFYSEMFASPAHKQRPGYANFEIAEPPLKLVLFEHPDADENLNHIGVECQDEGTFDAAVERLTKSPLATGDVAETGCCHAKQSKFWVPQPDGLAWEWYYILDDAPENQDATSSQGVCCGKTPAQDASADQVCCA